MTTMAIPLSLTLMSREVRYESGQGKSEDEVQGNHTRREASIGDCEPSQSHHHPIQPKAIPRKAHALDFSTLCTRFFESLEDCSD